MKNKYDIFHFYADFSFFFFFGNGLLNTGFYETKHLNSEIKNFSNSIKLLLKRKHLYIKSLNYLYSLIDPHLYLEVHYYFDQISCYQRL